MIQKMMEENKDAFDKLRQRNGLEINTVHQFQGDEKDIILFSQTVANGATPGQLSFLRETGNLFNVAITRAKALLIAVLYYTPFSSHVRTRYLVCCCESTAISIKLF